MQAELEKEVKADVEAVLTCDYSADLEQLDGRDVGNTLGIVEGSITKIKKLLSPDTGSSTPVDRSKIKMPARTKAEEVFGKHSHIGQVVMNVALKGVEALPFGAPVAAIIGFIYSRAAQVCDATAAACMHVAFCYCLPACGLLLLPLCMWPTATAFMHVACSYCLHAACC